MTSIVREKAAIYSQVRSWQSEGKVVGVVPTMGALHEGHMSLIEASLSQADVTVVTIFVNPLQFGPNEDLDKYPRMLEEDVEKCQEMGVTAVFAPPEAEMYPQGKENVFSVMPPAFYTEKLCGLDRPGHFDGVATVVTKLFNIIPADKAFFGQKDAQQLFIIKKMVQTLDFPVSIVSCPTVRESDGLAKSSRNLNLDADSRKIAPTLFKALSYIYNQYLGGDVDFRKLSQEAIKEFIEKYDKIKLEYLAAYDYESLEPTEALHTETLVAIAARVGGVRLIDNIIL